MSGACATNPSAADALRVGYDAIQTKEAVLPPRPARVSARCLKDDSF